MTMCLLAITYCRKPIKLTTTGDDQSLCDAFSPDIRPDLSFWGAVLVVM